MNFFSMFTTYFQLPMAGLKIKFSKKKFDWLAQSLASKTVISPIAQWFNPRGGNNFFPQL
jgi:hypothetical protein